MKIHSLLIIPFLFLCKPFQITAQNDSLDTYLLHKMAAYKNTNKDSALYYCHQLKKSENICKRLEAFTAESYIYYRQKEYEKSENILIQTNKKIDSLLKKVTNDCLNKRKIALYNRLFWLKKNQENYNEALNYLLASEQLLSNTLNKRENFETKLGIILNKAVIKNHLNLEEEALTSLKKGIATMQQTISNTQQKEPFYLQWKANTYNCLGNTFFSLAKQKNNLKLLDSAALYYKKSYDISKTFKPIHKDSEILYTFRRVDILMAKEQYTAALFLINTYNTIGNDFDYYKNESFQKAICFHHLNKTDSTLFYAYKTLTHQKQHLEQSSLITLYDILSEEYNNLHQIDSAYKYAKLTMQHFELAKTKKEATFQNLYENNFIRVKNLNQQIIEDEKNNKRKLYIVFAMTIVSIFVFFLLFYRRKQKSKELIIEELHQKVSETIKEPAKKEYNISEALENKIVKEIIDVNQKHTFLKANFSIHTIANKINTNATYVSFIFNKHYKQPFKQYYATMRINYVIEKLKTNATFRKYSIQAMAEEAGYTNASAFTRAFKKQVGETPSAFLKTLS